MTGRSRTWRKLRAELLEARCLLAVGELLHTLLPTQLPAQAHAHLGRSVASGANFLVTGVPFADDDQISAPGAAVVYNAADHQVVTVLRNPLPNQDDFFGWSVATAGNYVVVSAYNNDDGALNGGSVYVYDMLSASPKTPILTLNNPFRAANELFGWSVAAEGNLLVVGCLYDDGGAGSAYVYDLTSPTPATPIYKLANGTGNWNTFGNAVAISGNRVVVGAYQDDVLAANAGLAYVFDLTSAAPTTPIAVLNNPTPASGDYFGSAVAVAGNHVAVSAPFDDAAGSDAGAVYLYDLASSTPEAPVLTVTNPSAAPNMDQFGNSLAAAGTRLAVGALFEDPIAVNAGGAYVYDWTAATPTVPVVVIDNPTPEGEDNFGVAVAMHGSQIVVGANYDDTRAAAAGSAYVFDIDSAMPHVPLATLNGPVPVVTSNDFGKSVAAAGKYVVIGAATNYASPNNVGTAYVYDVTSPTPTIPFATLDNPAPATGGYFGTSVAVTGDYVVVGAFINNSGAGNVYVYDMSSATPTVPFASLIKPTPGIVEHFGVSVAASGNYVVVGSNAFSGAKGAAYVYDLSSPTPEVAIVTLNNPTPVNLDNFGISVAAADDYIVVGAPFDDTGAENAGSAYVYNMSSPTPAIPVAVLNNPAPASGDNFGNAVAASGSLVVVGAIRHDTISPNAGGAFVYDMNSVSPTIPIASLSFPIPEASMAFGRSVAAAGNYIMVGASDDHIGAINAGSVFIYDMSSASPHMPVAKVFNPMPGAGDLYGYAVAATSDHFAVGAYGDDTLHTNQGAAYVFRLAESPVEVIERRVFYNNSAFDGNSTAADASDDGAIAGHISALLPGNAATFVNYTNYVRGINGVMVDLQGAALPSSITAADFAFRTGNDLNLNNWSVGPAPSSVTVRDLGGGISRVTLIWPDGSIVGKWLEVTTLANAITGLSADDVFYFGNAPGDTGNPSSNAEVNASDFAAVRSNPRSFLNPAPIDDPHDFNRDRRVNAADLAIVRDHATTSLTALKLISPPASLAAAKLGDLIAEGEAAIRFAPFVVPSVDTGSKRGGNNLGKQAIVEETAAAGLDALDRLMATIAVRPQESTVVGMTCGLLADASADDRRLDEWLSIEGDAPRW